MMRASIRMELYALAIASPRPLKKMMSSFFSWYFSPLVYLFHKKVSGFIHPLGGGVGVRDVIVDDLCQRLLHPLGDLLPLHHRVTDVFPGNLDSVFLKLFSDINDITYLVRYSCSAFCYIKSHGRLFLYKVLYKRPVTIV